MLVSEARFSKILYILVKSALVYIIPIKKQHNFMKPVESQSCEHLVVHKTVLVVFFSRSLVFYFCHIVSFSL